MTQEQIKEEVQEEEVAVVTEEVEVEDKPEITQEDIRLVEAILFASSNPIDKSVIEERFPEDRAMLIPEILELLEEQYEARGVNLVKRANKWAFRTSSDLGEQMKLEKDQELKK